jgi:hypothetical protein
VNTNDTNGPDDKDEVAQALRAALTHAVATTPVASTSWDAVSARARRTVMVRRLTAAGACLAVACAVVGLVATSRGARRGVTVLGTETTTSSPEGRSVVRADALTFRLVQETMPYGTSATRSGSATPTQPRGPGSSCEGGRLVTPAPKQDGAPAIIVTNREKTACYILGPTLLTAQHVTTVEVASDPATSFWVVNLHFANNDFVTKVASPFVSQQVAIIVDGIVESTPNINAGITSNDVTIAGGFDQTTARQVAASIMPVGVTVVEAPAVGGTEQLMRTFAERCAAVAGRLGLGPFPATSMVTAATARAAFERAHMPVVSNLAGIDGTQQLAMCEGRASSSSGVTPTSLCPSGSSVDIRPLLLFAVDAKLRTTRLPSVQYLLPTTATAPFIPC